MFTLRAPLASSQVELRATLSSWPHSGQGLCRGTGGQHMQTFPSCVGVGRARQLWSEQTRVPHVSPNPLLSRSPTSNLTMEHSRKSRASWAFLQERTDPAMLSMTQSTESKEKKEI